MLLQMARFGSFLWLSNSPLLSQHIFIHSSADIQIASHVFAVVNSGVMNTGVHTSLGIGFFLFFFSWIYAQEVGFLKWEFKMPELPPG